MDRQLEQARLRLENLIDIHQLMMSAVEPDEVIKVILDSAVRLFSAEGCSTALIDKDEGQLVFAFSEGKTRISGFRIELGQGIVGWVAQSGEGVVCNDVSRDARFFGGVDGKTGFKTKSLLCAALKQRGQLIGAIEVLNTANPNGFTQEDLKLLTAFGALAGTAIDRAKVFAKTHNANVAFQEQIQDRYPFITGSSPVLQASVRLGRTVAPANTTVLLLGESGTGKEVMARAIHRWSPRSSQPFIAVNSVALTPELIESELFGHEKGSFTGAIAQKKGKFELADEGTIFLDEIGELTPSLQTKLLRVLQEKEFQRVGGTKNIRTHVRIIAATNRDLRKAIQNGRFREDLYYRLNVVSITMPPLRDHKEDIPELVNHFIDRYCHEVKRARLGIDSSAMDLLKACRWPGNVRELQNVIERAVVLCPGPNIMEVDFPPDIRTPSSNPREFSAQIPDFDDSVPLEEAVYLFKRTLIRKSIKSAGGNQAEAAKILGLQRSNLSRMMKSLGLR